MDCTFCRIVAALAAGAESDDVLAPPVLETDRFVALLDAQPLVSAAYHLLLVPRAHFERLADVAARPPALADAGPLLAVLAAALRDVYGVADCNIVQNNGPAAGQVVPHVHFHVVARAGAAVRPGAAPDPAYSALIYARGPRTDLEPGAAVVADALRAHIARVYGPLDVLLAGRARL
ncbi:histidine triad-like protein [Dipodascopsis tothii]|uniref:histidine triad-like protein n=1 Tax=Dipodascopsis tothii TaxID=44089 RepID=UPI0034CE6E43